MFGGGEEDGERDVDGKMTDDGVEFNDDDAKLGNSEDSIDGGD